MGIASVVKTGSRSSRSTEATTADETIDETISHTVNNAAKQEEAMAEQTKSANGEAIQEKVEKPGKLNLAEKPANAANGTKESGLALRTDAQQNKSIQISGLRPIAAEKLEIFGMILNNRPIEASHLQVREYVGHRPIFASGLTVSEGLMLPGGRPIFASDVKLTEAPLLTGGRPIASNEIDDSETLMGYID